jgi:hypothetical protein
MSSAFVSAQGSSGSMVGITSLLVLVAGLLIAWPLFRKFRHSLSANRRRRWVEQGLMDPPDAEPTEPQP